MTPPNPQGVDNLVAIRYLSEDDYPSVLEIEQQSFREPWLEKDFREFLGGPFNSGHVLRTLAGTVLGFVLSEVSPDGYHLVSLAVRPDCRRHGYGRALVERLQRKCWRNQLRQSVRVEVPESKVPLQLFFRACGFRAIEIARNYFENPTEDAYRFVWQPADSMNEEIV